MKILHTSDWHVGKTIRGRSRADEHRAVLGEIAEVADDRAVDLIVVVGDLFDTAAPTPEAEQIVFEALLGLAQVAPVVAVGGNHDNPRRLGAVAPLLRLGRITMAAEIAGPVDGGVVDVDSAGGETARLALFPFLSQRAIVRADHLMGADAQDHTQQYAHRAARILDALTEGFSGDTVNVVVAHAMVAGGLMGGGEREAHTIFEYAIPAVSFPTNAHYVALGHLHRAQEVPGPGRIHYSGSPLQLDFGETSDTKSVSLVEASPSAPARVEEIPLASGRRLRTLRGTVGQLESQAGKTDDDYLRIRVEGQARAGLADQIREWFPDAVDIRIVRPDEAAAPQRSSRVGLSPQQLFNAYLAEHDAADERVSGLFAELLESSPVAT